MNNAANVQETVTHNGTSNSRSTLQSGDVAAYQPAADDSHSPAAESVTFIWDDIQ